MDRVYSQISRFILRIRFGPYSDGNLSRIGLFNCQAGRLVLSSASQVVNVGDRYPGDVLLIFLAKLFKLSFQDLPGCRP